MSSPIQGKNATLRASNGEDYIDWLCATNCSLQVTTEQITTTTVGHGKFRKFKPRFTESSITLTGISATDDSLEYWTVFHSLLASLRNDGLNLELEFEDDAGGLKNVRCFAYITSTTINMNVEDFVDHEIRFQVSGALQLDDFTLPSDLEITMHDYTNEGPDVLAVYTHVDLIDREILEFSRDGIGKEVITVGTPNDKQVKYTASTGSFAMPTGNDIQVGEYIHILYK